MSVAPLGTAMTDPLTAVLKRTPPMTSSDHCWTVQLLPDEPPMALQVPIYVPFLVAAQELIGGWMERVRPLGLTLSNPHPALLVVDEDGQAKGLPINQIASYLYGTHLHGRTIVGPSVVATEVDTPDGRDLAWLTRDEAEYLASQLTDLRGALGADA